MYDNEDKQWLYGKFVDAGLDIGTYEGFDHSLQNDEDKKWYYEKATGMGLDVGTYDEFDKVFGKKPRQTKPSNKEYPITDIRNPKNPMHQPDEFTPPEGMDWETNPAPAAEAKPTRRRRLVDYILGNAGSTSEQVAETTQPELRYKSDANGDLPQALKDAGLTAKDVQFQWGGGQSGAGYYTLTPEQKQKVDEHNKDMAKIKSAFSQYGTPFNADAPVEGAIPYEWQAAGLEAKDIKFVPNKDGHGGTYSLTTSQAAKVADNNKAVLDELYSEIEEVQKKVSTASETPFTARASAPGDIPEVWKAAGLNAKDIKFTKDEDSFGGVYELNADQIKQVSDYKIGIVGEQPEGKKKVTGFGESQKYHWARLGGGIVNTTAELLNKLNTHFNGEFTDIYLQREAYDELQRRIEKNEPLFRNDAGLTSAQKSTLDRKEFSAMRRSEKVDEFLNYLKDLAIADGKDPQKQVLEWLDPEKNRISWLKKTADDILEKNDVEFSGAAKYGGLVPMVAGMAGSIALAATGNTQAAAALGESTLGIFSASGAGETMKQARDAGATNEQVIASGLTSAAIMYAFSKIPMGKYWKQATTTATAGTVNKSLTTNFIPEYERLLRDALKNGYLTEGNMKYLGQFVRGNIAEFGKSVASSTGSFAAMSAFSSLIPLIYENPDQYPVLANMLNSALQGAEDGLILGTIGASTNSVMRGRAVAQRNKRWKDQETIYLAEIQSNGSDIHAVWNNKNKQWDPVLASDKPSEIRFAEVLSYNKKTNPNEFGKDLVEIMMDDGNIYLADPSVIKEMQRFDHYTAIRETEKAYRDSGYDAGEAAQTPEQKTDIRVDNEYQTRKAENEATQGGVSEGTQLDVDRANAAMEGRRDTMRTQLEQRIGKPFWTGANGSETVDVVELQDGRTVFVLSEDEKGVVGVDKDGKPVMIDKDGDNIFQRYQESLNEYLDAQVFYEDQIAEHERMIAEQADNVTAMIEKVQQDGRVNLSAEENPVWGTVVNINPAADGGVTVQVEGEANPRFLDWKQVASTINMPFEPKSNEDLVADRLKVDEEVDNYNNNIPVDSDLMVQLEGGDVVAYKFKDAEQVDGDIILHAEDTETGEVVDIFPEMVTNLDALMRGENGKNSASGINAVNELQGLVVPNATNMSDEYIGLGKVEQEGPNTHFFLKGDPANAKRTRLTIRHIADRAQTYEEFIDGLRARGWYITSTQAQASGWVKERFEAYKRGEMSLDQFADYFVPEEYRETTKTSAPAPAAEEAAPVFTDPVANELGIDAKFAHTTPSGEVVVDGRMLWNENPELWAEWNDRNPDRGIPTREYLEDKQQKATQEAQTALDAYKAEWKGNQDPDVLQTLKAEMDKKTDRLQRINDLVKKYDDAEKAAQLEKEQPAPVEEARPAEPAAPAPTVAENPTPEITPIQQEALNTIGTTPEQAAMDVAQAKLDDIAKRNTPDLPRTRKVELMREKAGVLQEMMDRTGAENTVVSTREDILGLYKRDGAAEEYLQELERTLEETSKTGERVRGFFDKDTGKVYMIADDIRSVMDADTTYSHEDKHRSNREDGAHFESLGTGVTRQELVTAVQNLTGTHRYDGNSNAGLADEVLANAAEIAKKQGVEAIPGELRKAGIKNEEFINFVQNNIKNGRRRSNNRSLDERGSALQHRNEEVRSGQDGRNQQQGSGALEGQRPGTAGGSAPSVGAGETVESPAAETPDENGVTPAQRTEITAAVGGEMEKGPATKYSVTAIAEGAGLEAIGSDDNGNVVFIGPDGRRFTGKDTITADYLKSLPNTVMGYMMADAMRIGTVSNGTEGILWQKYADMLNAFLQKGLAENGGIDTLASQWQWIAETVYKTVASNSDAQYSYSLDITRVCKKNEAVIKTIAETQRRLGRGVTPAEIMEIYLASERKGYQVPCPVCYVFSRYIRNGQYATIMINGQKKYGSRLRDPRTMTEAEKEAAIKYWRSELDKQQKKNERNKKAITKAKADIQTTLDEIDKLGRRLLLGIDKGTKAEDTVMKIYDLDERYRAALQVVSQAGLDGWITNFAIHEVNGKWELYDDTFQGFPEEMALDLRETATVLREFPAIQRYRNSRGAAAGKEITFEANNDLGEVPMMLGVSDLKDAPNYYKLAVQATDPEVRDEMLKKARERFTKSHIYAQRQSLRGGQRMWSWSDNIERLSPDVFVNLMQMEMLGGALQSYSKQLEGINLVARMGGYVNGSLMGKGIGYREVDASEVERDGDALYVKGGDLVLPNDVVIKAPVFESEGKYYTLEFDDVVGIDAYGKDENGHHYKGLFELNLTLDKAGNILVGMNDLHVRAAMADRRVFFIIPWHSSGGSVHLLKQMLNYLGVDLTDFKPEDYTNVQEEKAATNSKGKVNPRIVAFWEAHKNETDFPVGISGGIPSGKDGKLSPQQIHYKELRDAIFVGIKEDTGRVNKDGKPIYKNVPVEKNPAWMREIMKDEFLSQTYAKVHAAVDNGMMTSGDTKYIYPYEYWDESSTYDTADVNGARYLEYCRRLGYKPKFVGKLDGKPENDFGNFADDRGYWKLLIDRRMYDTQGRFQDLTPISTEGFNTDLVDPEKTAQEFKVTRVADDEAAKVVADRMLDRESARPGGVATVNYDSNLDEAVKNYNAVLNKKPTKPTAAQREDLRRFLGNLEEDFGGRQSESGDSGLRLSVVNRNQDVFVSNAQKAVEGIKMEKATPEQWLKMIEKGGGLKAGEDKWIGLSDWLRGSDRKSLTKQEVSDFIEQNRIRIEEVNYGELKESGRFKELNDEYREMVGKESERIDELEKELHDFKDEMVEKYGGDYEDSMTAGERMNERNLSDLIDLWYESPRSAAFEEMVSQYGDDFNLAFDFIGVQEGLDPGLYINSREAAEYYIGEKGINSTRKSYTTEGLENNREIALTVPTIEPWNESDEIHFGDAGEGRAVAWIRFGDATVSNAKNAAEAAYREADKAWRDYRNEIVNKYALQATGTKTTKDLATPEENARVHELRMESDRLYHEWRYGRHPKEKVLVIDEIQSKRHQDAREKGYADKNSIIIKREDKGWSYSYTDSNDSGFVSDLIAPTEEDARNYAAKLHRGSVPAAPFEKNWHELAMKRMLRLAAEEGYDYVAWTTGEQQAERYSLGGVVNEIEVSPANDGTREVTIESAMADIYLDVDGQGTIVGQQDNYGENLRGKKLSDVVGKEMAARIMGLAEDETISGDGLRVGGEGMKGFYDDILPRFMNKYGKKWGTKVEDLFIPNIGEDAAAGAAKGLTMHAVPVTEEMKESVMGGQPMFSIRGGDELIDNGGATFSIVSDPKLIEELEASEKVTGIREVVKNPDGSYSSPMAGNLGRAKTNKSQDERRPTSKFYLNKWNQSEENPDLADENGKIKLIKTDNSERGLVDVDAVDYNPYIHLRLTAVNKQFKDAWKRPDLVYIESEVPKSEVPDFRGIKNVEDKIGSPYHAEKAALPVGIHDWNGGALMLSRYDKPVGEIDWEEVADAWANDEDIRTNGAPFDIVNPQLLQPLVDRGIEIVAPSKGKDKNEAYKAWEAGDMRTYEAWRDTGKAPKKLTAAQQKRANNVIDYLFNGAESIGAGFDSAIEDLNKDGISIDDKALLRGYNLSNVTLSKKGDVVKLDKLVVADQNNGNGTRFMNNLIAEADANGWTLALTPDDSFGATSVKRLKDFYKRFGFKENKGRNTDFTINESMVRRPNDARFSITDEDSQKLFDAAKERFGVTKNIKEAGYVLPDGAMLDFSGRHWSSGDTSWMNGLRQVDHRDISELEFDKDGNTPSGLKTDMSDFIRRGAIRIDSSGSINLATKPTAAQESVLRRLIDSGNGYVWVDFGDGYESDHSVSYDGIKPDRIINDIRRYFNEGVKPESRTMFSIVSAEEDAEYMEAANSGDEKRAQELVDKAAEKAGYTIKAFHGGPYRFNTFDRNRLGQTTDAPSAREGFFFTDDEDLANDFAQMSLKNTDWDEIRDRIREGLGTASEEAVNDYYNIYKEADADYQDYLSDSEDNSSTPSDEDFLRKRGFLDDEKTIDEAKRDYIEGVIERNVEDGIYDEWEQVQKELMGLGIELGHTQPVYLKLENPLIDTNERDYFLGGTQIDEPMTEVIRKAKRDGHDGVIFTDIREGGQSDYSTQYVIFNESHAKSRDTIERDDDGNIIPLSERFNDANDDIRFSVSAEEDAEYMEAANAGDEKKAGRLIEEAARRAGYNSPKLYHGSDAFGFTTIDSGAADDGVSFWATNKEVVAGSYTKLAVTRRPGTEVSADEYEKAIEIADQAMDDEIWNFRSLIDKYFSEWYFGPQGNEGIRKRIMDANHEPGYGDGVYDVLEDYVVEAYERYGEDFEGEYEDFADWEENSPEARKIFDSIVSLEGLRNQLWEIENGDLTGGIYELYANTDNMFVVDAHGKAWNELHPEGLPKIERGQYKDVPYRTRDVVKWAREKGYDGVIFKNVRDNGRYGRTEPSDVYAFLNPQRQVKSADPVTYDDSGNVIPLSERFNDSNDDIRFSLRGIIGAQNDADAMANLDVAEEMEKAGKDATTIWAATGWEKGVDGKWRNEIKDATPKVIAKNKRTFTVGDVVDAPELFKSYPEIKDYKVTFKKLKGSVGQFTRENKAVTIDPDYGLDYKLTAEQMEGINKSVVEYIRSEGVTSNRKAMAYKEKLLKETADGRALTDDGLECVLHELQHAIQYIEGFARGGNTNNERIKIFRDAIADDPITGSFAFFYGQANDPNKLVRFGKNAMVASIKNNLSRFGEQDQKLLEDLSDYLSSCTQEEYIELVRESDRIAKEAKANAPKNYHNLAGEVEARNVQARHDMSDEDRAAIPPSETEGVPRSEQGVRFSVTRQDSIQSFEKEGLAGVIGEENVAPLMRSVYAAIPKSVKAPIVDKALTGMDFRKPLNEYLHDLAAKGTENDETGLLFAMYDEIRALTGNPELTDGDIRYMIWKSTGESNGDILSMAEDIAMKNRWNVGKDEPRYSVRRQDLTEVVEDSQENLDEKTAAAAEKLKTVAEAVPHMSDLLNPIVTSMAAQKEYDRATVDGIVDFAKQIMKNGGVSTLTTREFNRLLTIIKSSTGKSPKSVTKYSDELLDKLIDHMVKDEQAKFDKLINIKDVRLNQSGVAAIGSLDVAGQIAMRNFRDYMLRPQEETGVKLAEVESKFDSEDQKTREDARAAFDGLKLASDYQRDLAENIKEGNDLENELDEAKDAKRTGNISAENYREFVNTTKQQLRENKIERVDFYRDFRERLAELQKGSKSRAHTFREAEKQRIEDIHHDANRDLSGVPANAFIKEDRKDRFINYKWLRFLLSPLATFDQMLRLFGRKNQDGQGWLYNRFGRGWVEARNHHIELREKYHDIIDKKATEIFGKKVKYWSQLFDEEKGMEGMTVRFFDEGEMRDFNLTVGNMLAIYAWNKQIDGKMKLRRMNISEEDVDRMKKAIDPRFIELIDWIQEEVFPQLQKEASEVYERMFGASMPTVENYFPLRINKNSRIDPVDLGKEDEADLSSTITGAFIKRQRNSNALDVIGTDALDLVLEHIDEMSDIIAFGEFRRDVNTLLSYKRFKNQVKNMDTIYGSNDELWDNFKNVAKIAQGKYKPAGRKAKADKFYVGMGKLVTGSKIAFRNVTALKQILSAPAFLSDARTDILAKNFFNPRASWNWAMENLPMLRERWKSRQVGDTRLMVDPEMEWKAWTNKFVEKAGRGGMWMNAFIDALTVSVGAKSVYDSKYQQYIEGGYSKEKADKLAKQDATISYNQSQQSSETMFTSAVQLDRTAEAVILTTYRNSSMGYQRRLHQALRTFGRMSKDGYREQAIANMTKQRMADGLGEDEARAFAEKEYGQNKVKAAVAIGVFGFLLELLWNFGIGDVVYMMFGDDDKVKKKMVERALVHTAAAPVEGLLGGNVVSTAVDVIHTTKSTKNIELAKMPMESDLEQIVSTMSYDAPAAWAEVARLIFQANIGFNPQTFTDAAVAALEYFDGDIDNAREFAIFLMRINQFPQSTVEDFMLDEIDMTVGEARQAKIEELARRYADYKMNKATPLNKWMYNDELYNKRHKSYEKKFKKKVTDRENLHVEDQENN